MPPQTFGSFRPASRATSTNWTGDEAGAGAVASTTRGFLHFHSGVVRASVSVLPSTKRDDPRKRRRGKIMVGDDYSNRGLSWLDRHEWHARDARRSRFFAMTEFVNAKFAGLE